MEFLSPLWWVRQIDKRLNNITMYRLVLWGLLFIAGVAICLSWFGFLTYGTLSLLVSLIVLLGVCFSFNLFLGWLFQAPLNIESSVITALILFLIMLPSTQVLDLLILVLAGVLSMASKYFLAWRGKHIFNPVAIALVILGLVGLGNAFWWVGSAMMFPFVLVIGLLVVWKIRRFAMFTTFLLFGSLSTLFTQLNFGLSGGEILNQIFLSSPLFFFGAIMLTEPLTTPATKRTQIAYGLVVGVLFGLVFSWGPVYSSPELALVVGNMFAYAFIFRRRLVLTLKEKLEIGKDIWQFVFSRQNSFSFQPGQYLEWTLPAGRYDSRGNRRYFTIASSPTEKDIILGVKFNPDGSLFKDHLQKLQTGETLVAGSLMGDFLLPKDPSEKLVFIAGGIGVTPFRSMIKYLSDSGEKHSVILFYTVKDPSEIVYRDVWQEAEEKIGLQVVYVITDKEKVPPSWSGEVGFIDSEMIKRYVSDFRQRRFYLSGPNAMVDAYRKVLHKLGVTNDKIMTDYFPGF